MSFSAAAKRLRPAHLTRRHVSTAPTPSQHASHRTLPSAKMRALISLYHQSETFVTPENLTERIEHAFVTRKGEEYGRTAVTVKELEAVLKDRRSAPKLSQWNYEPLSSSALREMAAGMWSDPRSARERKVAEALYGVDLEQSPVGALPGLDVLEESKEVVERSLKEDLEAARLEDRSYPDPAEKV